MSIRRLLVLALALAPSPLTAQEAVARSVATGGAAAAYEERFTELMQLDALPDRVADVSNLVLQRDVAKFTLTSGKLYLLTPVGGRTVAAVFRGKGAFTFAPRSPIEQDRLARSERARSLEAPVTDLVLLFADSTLAELESRLTFRRDLIPNEIRSRTKSALEYLGDQDSKTFEPDLMGAFLNGETSQLFYAHVVRARGGPLMFTLNPNEAEAVRLQNKVSRRWGKGLTEVICQFPAKGQSRTARVNGDRVRQADVERYTIETTLMPSLSGDINFSAAAKLQIVADTAVGPWVAFVLFEKLRVDSARWEGGEPAVVFRGRDSHLLWLRLDRQILPGDVRTLSLHYRGDLIDRFVDFFQIKSSAAWYPRPLEGRSLAVFDLTFSTTESYLLASVGDRVDSSKAGRMVRTRWVTQGRIRNASFNLGLFKAHDVKEAGVPPVTVMISDASHRKLKRVFAQQRNMRERVGSDVVNSLRFFQSVYGPTSLKHFYATEIPGSHGEAFPGMVHLSWATFQGTDDQGADELFRAHEVAHQWWGIGVDFESYHDQWLSEGFSQFSGLWYLQMVKKDNEKYFEMLRRWRSSILHRKDEPGPISLGYRVGTLKAADYYDDYSTIVYYKGAWAVHMLRILMLDLKTMNEDRFTRMLRDFYAKYEGRRASTQDFRRVVEQHTGTDMGWFFDQWIYSSALPTYRVAYRSEPAENGQHRVKLRVRQENVPDHFQTYVPVTLDLGKERIARVRVKVQGPISDIELPLMPAAPKSVQFNDLEGVLAEVKMVDWKD